MHGARYEVDPRFLHNIPDRRFDPDQRVETKGTIIALQGAIVWTRRCNHMNRGCGHMDTIRSHLDARVLSFKHTLSLFGCGIKRCIRCTVSDNYCLSLRYKKYQAAGSDTWHIPKG